MGNADQIVLELYKHEDSNTFIPDAAQFLSKIAIPDASSKTDPKLSVTFDGLDVYIDVSFIKDATNLQLYTWEIEPTSKATVSVRTEQIPHNHKPFYLSRSSDGFVVTLITLDSSNVLRLLTITSGTIASQKSPALDYLPFDSALPRTTANPAAWEYWILGTTRYMNLSGFQHTFANKVGFLFGLK